MRAPAAVIPLHPRKVLADYLPHSLVVDLALILGLSVLIGLSAQVVIPLPFTPVPITGQTFAVLLGGAALGGRRAFAGTTLYLLAGWAAIPWFAQGSSHVGATAGYLLAFPLAAALVGWLASRGIARGLKGSALAMLAGEIIFYLGGVPWLMLSTHMSLSKAIVLGVLPFLPGDALKVGLAIICLPIAWTLVDRLRGISKRKG